MSALHRPNTTPDTLLKNIITLTEQRDQLSLEASLFQALGDILEPAVLISLEWSGGHPEYEVLRETPATHPLPEAVLATARSLSKDLHHMGIEQGIDYLLMEVEAMVDGSRRVLVLGRPAWNDSSLRMARGMLRVYQNFVRLLNDSEKDTLTGLMNRKRLEKHLVELLASRRQGRRGEDRLSNDFLAVLDIDHFKAVNDNHGHLIGDEVLLVFANVMRRSLRDDDRCYRYGGEEFIVLLRDMDREQANSALERLRGRVSRHAFPQIGHLTVSIGFSLIDDQTIPSRVIEEADRALYYAKSHGRDQVREFQALIQSGEVRMPDTSGTVELF